MKRAHFLRSLIALPFVPAALSRVEEPRHTISYFKWQEVTLERLYNISPVDTPFISAITNKGNRTLTSWQTDTLR